MNDAGFSIFEHVLSSGECESIARALDGAIVHRKRAGARNLMANPAISKLASDSRLLEIANMILGTDAVPFRATLFDKSGNANWHVLWHQDRALPLDECVLSAEWGPWSIKSGVLYALAPAWALKSVVALRVYLDSSTNENGPLHVIPGSHKAGVLSSAHILRTTSSVPAKPCLIKRGGVMAMRPLLLHSSVKATGDQPRRVLHVEYAMKLSLRDVRLCVA